MEETIIALAPRMYSNIETQLTLIQQGKKSYINSVNIIYKKKIIQKIKSKGALKENTPENFESIISSFFKSRLKASKPTGSVLKKDAKKRAASEFMNEFNI